MKDSDILNLPDAPDFISKPPEIDWETLSKLCEERLPELNKIRFSKPINEIIGEPFKLD